MGSISRKGVILVGSHVTNAVMGLIVLLMVGRYLTPGSYGAYVFGANLVGLVATVAHLGYGQAHTRHVAQGGDLGSAVGVFTRIRTITILSYVTIFLLALLVWYKVLGGGFTDATTLEVVLVILLASVIAQWRRVATATWRGQGRVHRIEWGNFADAFVFAIGVASVALATGSAAGRWMPMPGLGAFLANAFGFDVRPDAATVALFLALAHLAGRLAALVVYSFWWFRDRVPVARWDRELGRQYTRYALPVAFTGMLSVLLTQTDILMVGYFWNSHEVGLYDAARRLAKFGLIPTVALRTIVFPYFARLMKDDHAGAMDAFRAVEKYLLLFVVPLGVAMMVWARAGINVAVGGAFLDSSGALRFLALWTILLALGMPVRLKHLAAGKTRTVMSVMSINVTMNVVFNLIFIPTSLFGFPMLGFGARGSAMATVLATFTAYLYNRWRAKQDFGVPLFDGAQARILTAGLVVATFWFTLRTMLPPTSYDRVYELAAIGLAGLALYGATLWAVGGLRARDIRFIRAALQPKGLVDEMRGRGGDL